MNRVRALGRRARREARTEQRLLRGLPARRPSVAPAPSGALRHAWQSAGLRHDARPSTPRLLGPRHPSASLAGRATVPVRSRASGPVEFGLPMRIVPAGKIVVVEHWPTNEAWPTSDDWNDVEPWVSADEQQPAATEPVAEAPVAEIAEVAPAPASVAEAEPGPDPDPEPVAEVTPVPVVVATEPEIEPEPEPAITPVAEAVPAPGTTSAAEVADDLPHRTAAHRTTPETAAPPIPASTPGQVRHRRRHRRRLTVVAAVVVLAVAGTVGGVLATRSGGNVSSAAAGTGIVPDDAVNWMRANVASSATVVATDAEVVAGLKTDGLAVTLVDDLAAAPTASVVVGAIGAAPTGAPVAVNDTLSLVPLARFDATGGGVEIGQLVDRSASDVDADEQSQQDTAAAASSGLLDNAAVTVDPMARPVFQGGTLDLRAAAFVAVVAGGQPVRVVSAPQDASEKATGLPVRCLVVAVDDRGSLQRSVDSARYPYAPTVTSAGGDDPAGSLLLTWPIAVDRALVVN